MENLDIEMYEPEEIPDSVIDIFARCLLPKIQAYFESSEGQAEFEQWKQENSAT